MPDDTSSASPINEGEPTRPQPLRFVWERELLKSDLPSHVIGTPLALAVHANAGNGETWRAPRDLVPNQTRETSARHISVAVKAGWLTEPVKRWRYRSSKRVVRA